MAELYVTSESLRHGDPMPVRHALEGENLSPQLSWSGLPDQTQSIAVICEDPDAPSGTFVLHAKPGHFEQVAEIYSQFAADFLSEHPTLQTVLVLGDEASGVVRGVGVWTDREAADDVNSDSEFASFNDTIGPLLASPSKRVELQLLHHYSR